MASNKYLNRFMDNTVILSKILCDLDLKNYFDRQNRTSKQNHDKYVLVNVTIGCLNIKLTEREAHSALLILFGYTVKDIARYMMVSPRTAEHYLSCIKQKLYINRKSDLVITLLQSDFIKKMVHVIKNAQKTKDISYL